MHFFKLILEIFNVFSDAKRIRDDEEKRQKSVRFALISIIYSLLMIACAFGGSYLLTADLGFWALLIIFIIAFSDGILAA